MTLPTTVPLAAATGAGATDLDALDDAFVAAGVGDYNLVEYSSVLPAGARVERCDRVPADRYPVGAPVGVVLARAAGREPVAAGVGWVRSPDGGVFFEASGSEPETVETEVRAGLAGAVRRRDRAWETDPATAPVVVASREPPAEGAAAAAVVAVHDRLD